jgi:hypothetical protein
VDDQMWTCCYCAESVPRAESIWIRLYYEDEQSQEYRAHKACVIASIHPSVRSTLHPVLDAE